jgi:hypothetical protein
MSGKTVFVTYGKGEEYLMAITDRSKNVILSKPMYKA